MSRPWCIAISIATFAGMLGPLWNHSDVLKELVDVGLESAYHFARAEAQGRNPSHILYASAP